VQQLPLVPTAPPVLPIHHHEAADDGGAARRSRLGGNRDGQDVGAYDVPTLKKDS
jgi:hypothetical protein